MRGEGEEGGGGRGEVILRSRRNIWRTETRVRGEGEEVRGEGGGEGEEER